MASKGLTTNRIAKIANEALTRDRFVNLVSGTPANVELTDAQADDDVAFGVTEHAAAAAEHVSIGTEGEVFVECGEAIAVDQLVTCGAAGVAMVADSGNYARGRARTAGAGSGSIIVIRLLDQQVVA